MAGDDSIRINDREKFQQEVMKKVLEQLRDTPYVLKGGAALLFTRGLDRHTTDLDFDSSKPLNIENRLREGMKMSGAELISFKAIKNTDTVQRFKIHYRDPKTHDDVLFKVETSFRKIPDPTTIELVDGIRTYTVNEIFEQKLHAAQSRTQARDLYDLTHLIQNFGDEISAKQIKRASDFSEDMEGLVSRYTNSFQLDAALNERTTIDDTVLSLREGVETQLHQHELLVQQLDPEALASYCTECIEMAGVPKDGGFQVEGNHYIFRRQDKTISISTKDGRGTIFQYDKQGVESYLTADDIKTLNKLPTVNAQLWKEAKQQPKPTQGRSRSR